MNLTIKSRDGLSMLQKVYEGYENANIQKDWQIGSVNSEGVVSEITVKIDIEGIPAQEDGQLLKIIALEALRIKQLQYLKRFKPNLKSLGDYDEKENLIPNEIMAIALDSVDSSYYVNLIAVLLTEHLKDGRDTLDLSAFARFNLRDYNKDFEIKVEELRAIQREVESGFFGINVEEDIDGSFVGNPFEIMRALGEAMILDDSDRKQEVDITVIGREDGSFDVSDGANLINREVVENALGFSFDLVDAEDGESIEDYGMPFEASMLMVLYALIFLKTKLIYIKDEHNQELRKKISSYLENAGVYPEYSPYLIETE